MNIFLVFLEDCADPTNLKDLILPDVFKTYISGDMIEEPFLIGDEFLDEKIILIFERYKHSKC